MLTSLVIYSQTGQVRGIVLDENSSPVAFANITFAQGGTQSNENGFYQLEVPSNQEVVITISYVGYKNVVFTVDLKPNEFIEINPVLKVEVAQIGEVVISSKNRAAVQGITTVSPEAIRKIPGANPGVENLLKTLPGVSSNNELSTQYSVRGGNFDENLVYVNEIEVYRPFLIRSGQQEGLSFVNTDLVRTVDFSAGGFQAKYGDKLSSVLDITYRRPVDFGGRVNLNLLGGSAAVEGVSANNKFSGIIGVRYRDNSLLVDARETETNYDPSFADVQAYLTYQFSKKFEVGFLGNIAVNEYNYEPETRQTNFGTLQDPIALLVFYDGQEEDRYDTYFGALKATYTLSENYTAKLIASTYHTKEQEHFDILAQYRLGAVNTDLGSDDLGEVEFSEAVGGQLTSAKNDLDALITTVQHKGQFIKDRLQLDYGIKYNREDIRDRVREFEVIDSAGFSVRPPLPDFQNNQPYEPFDAPLEPFTSVRAFNETVIERVQSFAQASYKTQLNNHEIWLNGGVRSHAWTVDDERTASSNSQHVFSPRAQVAIKPDWKTDMLFRVSGGVYYQPPFYRELRDSTGTVRPQVKAQRSLHLVLGNEYSFNLWNRPFTLTSEAYFKELDDVNPYTIENVRIRYRARNNAEAYAYGLDLRLNGEFVPGTESWVSIGVLKTEENIDDRGYIARPTDQRFKFAALFQDYVPKFPNFKAFLNLVYNTGLPGGSPSYADPYDFQTRLRDYRRVDFGVLYVVTDETKPAKKGSWLANFEELNVGVEIFNMFDNQNSITNTFVRDAASQQLYAVPNFLTPRVFNIRLGVRF
ncbi:carboxypeptidase-like regulatory domain-containing protein [Gangjinia marincola]|uniref:Carboxypeptidase-like regulatory domain-containing protein n=1 Tax=Gangjinia marincola TaxID=578463 RepID=A0ABN1MGI5_9FLAO